MNEQPQLGFIFETEAELLAESLPEPVQEESFSPIEIGSQSFLLPELEEEAKERAARAGEDEVPWVDYIRQVQLFFSVEQHEEFKELASKLAAGFGTKNMTDTVAEAMRRCIGLI